jgi:hypothetical protein
VRRHKKKEKQRSVFDLLFGPQPVEEEVEEEKPKKSWYVGFCKYTSKWFGKSAKKKLSDEYKVALAFLGWDLKPQEVNSAPLFVMYFGFALVFLWCLLQYLFSGFLFPPIVVSGITLFGYVPDLDLPLIVYLGPFLLVFGAMYYVQSYPLRQVEKEKIKALAYMPEIVNYLVMSMKVSPNLERAIKFAAEHGHGKVADDFKKLHYDIQIGKYKTVEEALDYMAWKWGEYSEEFKHALMLIRSSVMEVDEGKRSELLDKAVADVLAGIKDKMDMYSRAMHQPAIYLYYFGVLLPLLLIIIVPVGSMLAAEELSILSNPVVMVFIFNVLIPVSSFFLARTILESRPPTRPVPRIPKNFPGLPRPGWFKLGKSEMPVLFLSIIIITVIAGGGYFFEPVLNPPPICYLPPEECPSHIPMILYAGITIGIVSGISFYLWANNKDRRKLQLEIVEMENEFQDTLYVIASRLGEGKPMEEALKHAADFLPKSPATQRLFIPTLQNITFMGMTLKSALFDKAYGSLRYVPSSFIKGTMLIVVESLSLGVQTAARSLVSLSLQLQDSQKIERSLKAMLQDITSMMSVMSTFIAPVVLGITIALQKIIFGAAETMATSGLGETEVEAARSASVTSFQMPSFSSPEALENAASEETLIAIISIYVIEIVVVLIYFASHVNEGDNDLAFKIALAKTLPIAVTVFFAVAFFAMQLTALSVI